ncbi:MAG: signal peptidase I [Candidatus Caenarcaniphilales bacterium]|nr:signal peptidase I [Candidatus Caenarcaniphilales bacterium]
MPNTMEPSKTENEQLEEEKEIKGGIFYKWNLYKASLSPSIRIPIEILEFCLTLIILLVVIRQGLFERRYIPSESMLPNLQIQDQLIIEKVSLNLHSMGMAKDIQRGDVLVFYPPPAANRGIDLKRDFPNTFVRLTGLSSDIQIGPITLFPFLPKAEDAYIKRTIGLPGDKVEIRAGDGVYINDNKLNESFTLEKPIYSMKTEAELYNMSIACGTPIDISFKDSSKPLVVPANHFLMLGDNRNNSKDGHCWGFLPRERVIGRAMSIIWRDLGLKPDFSSPYERIYQN